MWYQISNRGVRLTPNVRVCTVHHVCGVDKVVAGTLCDQLQLGKAQDQLSSGNNGEITVSQERTDPGVGS